MAHNNYDIANLVLNSFIVFVLIVLLVMVIGASWQVWHLLPRYLRQPQPPPVTGLSVQTY